jgi:hypothetical protein
MHETSILDGHAAHATVVKGPCMHSNLNSSPCSPRHCSRRLIHAFQSEQLPIVIHATHESLSVPPQNRSNLPQASKTCKDRAKNFRIMSVLRCIHEMTVLSQSQSQSNAVHSDLWMAHSDKMMKPIDQNLRNRSAAYFT